MFSYIKKKKIHIHRNEDGYMIYLYVHIRTGHQDKCITDMLFIVKSQLLKVKRHI